MVKFGDVFFILGGRFYVLGEGILMLEIMELLDLVVWFEFEWCGYVILEVVCFMNCDIEIVFDVFDFLFVIGESIDLIFCCLFELILDENGGNMLESLIDFYYMLCFCVRCVIIKGIFFCCEIFCFYGIVVEGCGMIKMEN